MKYLLFIILFTTVKISNAQYKLDTLKVSNVQKKLAYSSIPDYDVFTQDSMLINLPEYLKTHRQNKEKPTLLITWSYKWCKPCMKKIDTLLRSGAAVNYNIVLINRDEEVYKTSSPSYFISMTELKKDLALHLPNYNENTILLYDRNGQMVDIDNGEAPLFVWLDKNLTIVSVYGNYLISAANILDILAKIEQGKMAYGKSKYVNNRLIPCEADVATNKFTVSSSPNSDIVTLSAYEMNKPAPSYEMDFSKTKKGKLIVKSVKINK